MGRDGTQVRLHVDADLAPGAEVPLDPGQRNYLRNVLRLAPGDGVRIFNGRAGEWQAAVVDLGRRTACLACAEQVRAPALPPDLWLLFAPLKRARTDHVVEKACELGCRRVQPVLTERTESRRVRTARLRTHAVEAAEQCGLLSVPEIAEPEPLGALLGSWPAERRLLFCDERGGYAPPVQDALAGREGGPWAVLVGPEGGFAPAEAERVAAHPAAVAASLGPRLLRADTAAVAALAVWQSVLGDWRGGG